VLLDPRLGYGVPEWVSTLVRDHQLVASARNLQGSEAHETPAAESIRATRYGQLVAGHVPHCQSLVDAGLCRQGLPIVMDRWVISWCRGQIGKEATEERMVVQVG
jgi:hypothetical protein